MYGHSLYSHVGRPYAVHRENAHNAQDDGRRMSLAAIMGQADVMGASVRGEVEDVEDAGRVKSKKHDHKYIQDRHSRKQQNNIETENNQHSRDMHNSNHKIHQEGNEHNHNYQGHGDLDVLADGRIDSDYINVDVDHDGHSVEDGDREGDGNGDTS